MRIAEAVGFDSLRNAGLGPRIQEATKTALELARDIFAEAEGREQPFLYHTPETWVRKWLPSNRFKLVRLPLNAVAMPCEPKVENLVLKKIHAREEKPIIVDYNRNQVGKSMHGFVPQVIVIDGKHRFKAASLRGETHIMAWVGEHALSTLHGFGSGGGPAPESTTPAPGAKLNARGSEQSAKLAQRIGTTYSGEGKKLKEMNVEDVDSAGTSEGATKGWDTRGRGRKSGELDKKSFQRLAQGMGYKNVERNVYHRDVPGNQSKRFVLGLGKDAAGRLGWTHYMEDKLGGGKVRPLGGGTTMDSFEHHIRNSR